MSDWFKKRLILVLWPSFLTAGLAEIVFFTLVDPQELFLMGEPVHFPLIATYTIGFGAFWALTILTSALTLFFIKPANEINGPLH